MMGEPASRTLWDTYLAPLFDVNCSGSRHARAVRATLQGWHQDGTLARLLPEIEALFGVPQRADYHPEIDTGLHTLMVVEATGDLGGNGRHLWAALLHDIGKGTTPASMLPRHHGHEAAGVPLADNLHQRLGTPARHAQLARLAVAEHGNIHAAGPSSNLRAPAFLRLIRRISGLQPGMPLKRIDAHNDDINMLDDVLLVAEADARGRGGDFPDRPYPQSRFLRKLASAATLGLEGQDFEDAIALIKAGLPVTAIPSTRKPTHQDSP